MKIARYNTGVDGIDRESEDGEMCYYKDVEKLQQALRDKESLIRKILTLPQEEFESGWYFAMDVVHMGDIKEILGIEEN